MKIQSVLTKVFYKYNSLSINPLFTVITVVFNAQNSIEKTIESVLIQSFSDYEYIIIDGGSTDLTINILNKYTNRINKIISEKDKGIYDAMNKGISLARGKWINFLNAGDVFSETDTLLNTSIAIEKNSTSNLFYINFKMKNILHTPLLNLNYLLNNMICHQSLFYHYSLFTKYNFDINLQLAADYKHLLKIWPNINPYKISTCSVTYEGGGVSADRRKIKQLYQERCISIVNAEIKFSTKILFFTYNYFIKILKY